MARLGDLFKQHGVDFGYAVDSLSSARQNIILGDGARVITTEGALKLASFRPQRYTWRKTKIDEIVDFGMSHGIYVHGHTPVWWLYNPSWFINLNPHTLSHDVMRESIEWIAKYWKYKLYSLDVVNEAMDAGGYPRGKYAEGWRQLHPDGDGRGYAYWCMGASKKKMFNVRRVYNGVFIHKNERDMALDMARRDVIDAVGWQTHWNAGDERIIVDHGYLPWIRKMVGTGKEFYLSEIDVSNGTQVQRIKTWQTLARLAIDEGLDRFLVWGIPDGSGTYKGTGMLYNRYYQRKQEFYGLMEVL